MYVLRKTEFYKVVLHNTGSTKVCHTQSTVRKFFKVEQDCHTPLKVSQDALSSHIIDRFKYLFSLIL